MKRVTGSGGIFFNAKDPVALRAWYKTHLGIDVQAWSGAAFTWTADQGNPMKGTTIWSIGSEDGDLFAPSRSSFMINYRVETLALCYSPCGTKVTRCWKKPMSQSTANLARLAIPRAIKWSCRLRSRTSEELLACVV